MPTYEGDESVVVSYTKEAVEARKKSLVKLRSRIESLLEFIPVGVTLADDNGVIGRMERVCTGIGQWANREWDVTIKGKGLVIGNNKLVCENLYTSYRDGSNTQQHRGAAFCLLGSDDDRGNTLSWLSGEETRSAAVRLPRALSRYIAECAAETEADRALSEVLGS